MASGENEESTLTLQLNNEHDENGSDIEDGFSSDNSSANDINDLLHELDPEQDITPCENDQNSSDEGQDQSDNEDILCVDTDNLSADSRNPDDMHDILNKDPEWTQNFSQIHVNQFTGPIGTNFPVNFDTPTASSLEYFQLFFSDDVFKRICNNTNKFKKFHVEQKKITSPDYKEQFWYDTNVNEMRAYFGLAVLFALLNQPRYRNYWSKDPFLGNPGVQRVFSLKRYSKISEYLHVSDRELEKNRGHQNYEKLGKIRWLYEHLRLKFAELKYPEKVQVLDEQIMPFSGRISYLQYNVSDLDLDLITQSCTLYDYLHLPVN